MGRGARRPGSIVADVRTGGPKKAGGGGASMGSS